MVCHVRGSEKDLFKAQSNETQYMGLPDPGFIVLFDKYLIFNIVYIWEQRLTTFLSD
jgi:hypothetical protein